MIVTGSESAIYNFIINQIKCVSWRGLMLGLGLCLYTPLVGAEPVATNGLVIQSVEVDKKLFPVHLTGDLNLGAFPKQVVFHFSVATNDQSLIRLRYKLEGYKNDWSEGRGFAFLGVRFYDKSLAAIGQKNFQVSGESPGWNGSVKTSPLVHRRETLDVPPNASLVSVVISSAGPPATVGIYVVANLLVSGYTNNQQPAVLIQSPFDHQPLQNSNILQPGWTRDGTHLTMAKILDIGEDPPIRAFAIEDNDPACHAEWRAVGPVPHAVTPGQHLIIEWNEMFSIGLGDYRDVPYDNLPAGNYQFHIIGVDIMGKPGGEEASIRITVPQPFWRRSWFWGTAMVFAMLLVAGSVRYLVWRKMRLEMQRLKNQQALERERLRIAHDIHDDLGARVTQISLISAMFRDDLTLPEKARAGFGDIKMKSQDLVSALYETVWAVNPENDNLAAMGDYLCQTANQLCEKTHLRCRLQVEDLPSGIQITSQARHNIVMVVKETLHNVIKHASASEVKMEIAFSNGRLVIVVEDNGCGISSGDRPAGNGLVNMRQRMENIGGDCSIEPKAGAGTIVRLSVAPGATDYSRESDS